MRISNLLTCVPAAGRGRDRGGQRPAGRPRSPTCTSRCPSSCSVDDILYAVTNLPREDRWSALARAAMRHDVYAALAAITTVGAEATPTRRCWPPSGWRLGRAEPGAGGAGPDHLRRGAVAGPGRPGDPVGGAAGDARPAEPDRRLAVRTAAGQALAGVGLQDVGCRSARVGRRRSRPRAHTGGARATPSVLVTPQSWDERGDDHQAAAADVAATPAVARLSMSRSALPPSVTEIV